MVIMQTEDAKKRREHIQANDLAKVIFEHEYEDSVCIQYHPKGFKGTFTTWSTFVAGASVVADGQYRRHDA